PPKPRSRGGEAGPCASSSPERCAESPVWKWALTSLARGDAAVDHLITADLDRIAELVARYADLPLGMVDASVVGVAERLGVAELATIDRRDFNVVRPRHVEAFTLLP
ncbi:MAG: hypothetical protein ACYCVV_17480, partial [Acidimicrobiales bacterium]